MIQTTENYKHVVGTQAIIGKLEVEVISIKFERNTKVIFEIEDRVVVDDVSFQIATRTKDFPLEYFESELLIFKENNATTNLNEVEIINLFIEEKTLFLMQNDLYDNGLTSYGFLPNNWIKI